MHQSAVLFVCLGNICRSPMAEGAFRRAAAEAGLDLLIDSAGTGGWHAGSPPDPRAVAKAREEGVDISSLRARQLDAADFRRFTHVLVMDHQNLADACTMVPTDAISAPRLLMDLVTGREGASVADPYYGGKEHFDDCWQDVNRAARALAAQLAADHAGG